MTYPTHEQHLVAHMRVAIVFGSPENAAICKCGFGRGLHLDDYDARERAWVEHVAETWDDAMTVTTRDQLDALPPGSAVRDRHGCILELDPTASRAFWIDTGQRGEVGPPALPARILSLPKPVPGTTTPEPAPEPAQAKPDGNTTPEKPTVTITLNTAASEKLIAGLLDATANGGDQ